MTARASPPHRQLDAFTSLTCGRSGPAHLFGRLGTVPRVPWCGPLSARPRDASQAPWSAPPSWPQRTARQPGAAVRLHGPASRAPRGMPRTCLPAPGHDGSPRSALPRADASVVRPVPARRRSALLRVRSVVWPFFGGGRSTPARRAFDKAMAIACLVERAPCLPSRMWCISSRTNSPAWVVGDFPWRLSRRALSKVSFSGMACPFRALLVAPAKTPHSS